ncbi:Arabinogalactan peptide 20 [Spatholobus suberectus]|nr:Arabinogalactan peptide 20 [Spatholobus suberectus]
MAFLKAASEVLAIYTLVLTIFSPAVVEAQSLSLAPAPAPTSDGTSIDQGIAYVLMLVALVLTYLIHPFDASSHQF